MRDPEKENALTLADVDIRGKNTQEQDQITVQLPPQQVQRPAQYWRASQGGKVDCDSQQGKRCLQLRSKKNIYYSYILTCLVVAFGFFSFFPFLLSVALLVDFISAITSIYTSEISFITLFISFKYICLYVGLLQFCFLFLFVLS